MSKRWSDHGPDSSVFCGPKLHTLSTLSRTFDVSPKTQDKASIGSVCSNEVPTVFTCSLQLQFFPYSLSQSLRLIQILMPVHKNLFVLEQNWFIQCRSCEYMLFIRVCTNGKRNMHVKIQRVRSIWLISEVVLAKAQKLAFKVEVCFFMPWIAWMAGL